MLSWLTGRRCPSGTGGQPGSVFLLGYHGIEPGWQAISCGRHGVLSVKEDDGALKLTALVGQLVGSQGMQSMFGPFDGSWVGGHGSSS
jgi:hypothetical protein